MSQALCFQSVEFDVIQQNQQPWVRGYQIGRALGYTAPDVQISKLYTRHADEFTPAMTAVVTLPTEGGPQETRIFSLRGCHLLAMFARTPVAKAFRKWVLDVIEQYGDRVPVAEPVTLNDELISASEALPAAPRFDEAAMLELAAEIREAQQNYSRTFGRLCSRLITMSIPVFTTLERRVYKEAPDRPFSGVRVGAQWERYFTERMIAALHSLDDRLPDEKNPAILLLEYARAMSVR